MIYVNVKFNENTKNVKMEMNETERKFATAAMAVFNRYGPRKATMEEIAAEAGVSKPTLYATFRNKDAALAAVIRLTKGAAVEAVRGAWIGIDDLGDKLDRFFDLLVVAVYDMLHSAPDASAFHSATGEASEEAIRETTAWETALIKDALLSCNLKGTTPDRYASFIVTTTTQAKLLSPSREELVRFLSELKLSVLAVAQ